MSERKATDILLDLESKIDNLINKINSQDLILKAQLIKIDEFIKSNSTKSNKNVKSMPKMSSGNEAIITVPQSKEPTVANTSLPEVPIKVEEPLLKVEEAKSNDVEVEKFLVSQRVLYETGKSIYLAAVEVIDMATKNKVARQTTSANGKYKIKLPAGSYRFKIYKQIDLNSPRVERMQDVVVVGNVELPDFVLK